MIFIFYAFLSWVRFTNPMVVDAFESNINLISLHTMGRMKTEVKTRRRMLNNNEIQFSRKSHFGKPISAPTSTFPPCHLFSSSRDSDGNQSLVPDEDEASILENKKFMERTKRWIVLVDDEESIRLAIGDYLYNEGYSVTACADADALFEVLSQQRPYDDNYDKYDTVIDGEDLETPSLMNGLTGEGSTSSSYSPFTIEETPQRKSIPDVILSDIRMPGKDGLELLSLLRADERLSRVPVVLLTAKALTSDRIMGYKAGADVYLTKPFDPQELLAIIDMLIKRRYVQIVSSKNNNMNAALLDLKEEMQDVKQILKNNAKNVILKTDVDLTPSERQILELLCKGYNNKEISKKYKSETKRRKNATSKINQEGNNDIDGKEKQSESELNGKPENDRSVNVIYVNRVIQTLYSKTGTKTRTELVRWAIKTGQVERFGR